MSKNIPFNTTNSERLNIWSSLRITIIPRIVSLAYFFKLKKDIQKGSYWLITTVGLGN